MTSRRRQADHHGYVVIDKPAGLTSHDVVSQVRRILGERRVGHAGTLDPAATGVLPIAVGLATRTVEYLADADKSYRASIRLGISTDSHDRDGRLTDRRDPTGVSFEAVERALSQFVGAIEQVPPMHSAIKVDGQRLYRSARAGSDVERAPRQVTIASIDVVDVSLPAIVADIICSKGTYIRAIARDLGDALGCGAYLSGLVRTRSGPFDITSAIPLDRFERVIHEAGWTAVSYHPEWGAIDAPAAVLDRRQAEEWRLGRLIEGDFHAPGVHRVYDVEGSWLGIGHVADDGVRLSPAKVFPPEAASTDV